MMQIESVLPYEDIEVAKMYDVTSKRGEFTIQVVAVREDLIEGNIISGNFVNGRGQHKIPGDRIIVEFSKSEFRQYK